MKCQMCGQHPASVHYTELSGNAAVEYHICQSCAQSKGLFKGGSGQFSLKSGEFLAGVAGSSEEAGSESDVGCESCGKTYAEFRETGRLGCGECYEAFGALLRPILRRVHGSTSHVGKAPAERAGERRPAVELVRLRDELRRALEREDFERCAELRDLIRQTERGTRSS